MSILDQYIETLQTLGISMEVAYILLVIVAGIVLVLIATLVSVVFRSEQFGNHEKEKFPSMAEISAKAQQAAMDAKVWASKASQDAVAMAKSVVA